MMAGVPSDRIAAIRAALQARFEPEVLEITDESHRHVGHAGARSGAGHFRLRIVAQAFTGRPPLERHRLVYAALDPLMQDHIHALAIEARAPSETDSPAQRIP